MFICLKCNSTANEADLFCRNCGSKIEFQVAEEAVDKDDEFNNNDEAANDINYLADEKIVIEKIPFGAIDVKILAIIVVVLLVFAVAFILSHISSSKNKFIGTGSNNRFIESGKWTYYSFLTYEGSSQNKKMGIYKLDRSGTEQIKLYEDYGSSITVNGDWIYYSGINDREIYIK